MKLDRRIPVRLAGLALISLSLAACNSGAATQSTAASPASASARESATPNSPPPAPSPTPTPSPTALTVPADAPRLAATLPPAPAHLLPAAPARPAPPPVVDNWRVVLLPFNPSTRSITVEVVNSRGQLIGACYNVLMVNVANPPPPVFPSSPTGPTTYRQTYQQCGMSLQLFANDHWGGSWSASGTATVNGRSAPVSASGTVAPVN